MHYTLYHIECVLYERESVCLLYVSYLSSMCTCQILVECVLYEVCLLYVSYISRMRAMHYITCTHLLCVIQNITRTHLMLHMMHHTLYHIHKYQVTNIERNLLCILVCHASCHRHISKSRCIFVQRNASVQEL